MGKTKKVVKRRKALGKVGTAKRRVPSRALGLKRRRQISNKTRIRVWQELSLGLVGLPLVIVAVVFAVFLNDSKSRIAQKVVEPTVATASATYSSFEAKKDFREFEEVAGLPLDEKIMYWSKYIANDYRKARQLLSKITPVPESRDTVPFIPNRFDCTTYVETVMALAKGSSSSDFYQNLIRIRYKDSNSGFYSRNHFPEADWIPNNISAGIIRDITDSIASASAIDVSYESKEINRSEWLAKQIQNRKISRTLASVTDPAWSIPVNSRVSYIPIGAFEQAIERIPNGTIINLVRKNDGEHPVIISHQGFLVREAGAVYLRHALPNGNIRNVLFKDYLKQMTKYQSKSWPVLGINLNQLKG